MADIVGAGLGAGIGFLIGGPTGAMWGLSIGQTLGSIYQYSQNRPTFTGGRLSDLKASSVSQASPWPRVWGTVRKPGILLWSPDKHESVSTTGGGGSLGGPRFENYAYTADLAVGVCVGEITRINKIWADSELVYDYNGGTPIWADWIDPDNVRVYTGTLAQGVDALIEAERVAAGDEAPAYVGRAYVVFEAWPWSRFGHDANMNFEIVRGTSVSLADIAEELLIDVLGLDPSEVDMTAVSGIVVAGFSIDGRIETTDALDILFRAYNADIVEVDGKLVGVLKDASPSFAIDPQIMGVNTDGDVPDNKSESEIVHELDMPQAVDVTYASAGHDHQVFTQKAVKLTATSTGLRTYELPLVLEDDHARQIAETFLYEEYVMRETEKTSWPLLYLGIAPGDVGTMVVGGETVTVRVLETLGGLFGHVESKLARHEGAIYTQYVSGAEPPNQGEVLDAGLTTIWVRDLPAVRDADVYDDHVLLYRAAARARGWAGATFIPSYPYVQFDIGSAYMSTIFTLVRATMGAATTTLGTGTPGVWDRTSTVTVSMVYGELASASEASVLAGANLAVLGDEVFQFATATLVSPGTYELSNLLRGRRGTEWAIGSHSSGEPFVLLNSIVQPSHFVFSGMGNAADWVHYDYSSHVGSNVVHETLEGNSRKPYSPCDVRGSRDGSLNLSMTWTRRARRTPISPLGEPPLDESSELYEVDVMDGSTVVRTISSTSASASYSAAEQTTDFGSPQSSIDVRVYQVVPGWGRGFARPASV